MSAKKKSPKSASNTTKKTRVFDDVERLAMRERAKEAKAEARRGSDKEDGERDVLAKIAEMQGSERAMATRLHALIKTVAPVLSPKTWYGMPAYAKEGKVLCFFQSADKFGSRYASFGFTDEANLDDGAMWPIYFALKELTPAVEKRIAALVRKAVS